MELNHFSHDHTLILIEEYDDVFVENLCSGCKQATSGASYHCNTCYFSLHKLCAELPQEMKHPLHPQHSLRLFTYPPYIRWICKCDACGEDWWKGFTYHCSICQFNVDIRCALMAQTFTHESHEHPLIPLQELALFFCHACRKKHEGTSFQCTTCRFRVHQKCATLPRTIKRYCHHHPLTLSYNLPPECSQFRSYCEICAKELNFCGWFYWCRECRYVLHLNCVPKTETLMLNPLPDELDQKTESEAEDIIKPNLIHLPAIDESIDWFTQFIKGISLAKDESARELKHPSHQHQLILSDVQSEFESRQSILKDVLCEGCIEPISFPLYSCSECNFFLHNWCAELPDELHHPSHPEHPLVLGTKPLGNFGMFWCNGCCRNCQGFAFVCAHCQFYLDVKCSSLPRSIRHEGHKHILKLRILSFAEHDRCSACGRTLFFLSFTCETCNFRIHPWCALLPAKVRHRYDEHPFSLTYSLIKDVQEYICEICEEDVNPKCWYYHCLDCDQSIHTNCLVSLKFASPISWKDNIRNFKIHPHPLKYLVVEDDDASCGHCGKGFRDCWDGFECNRCSLKLHRECTNFPNRFRHNSHKHPLTLVCFPIEGHLYNYYCRICKLEVDRKLWFYHCGDCNYFAHVECLKKPVETWDSVYFCFETWKSPLIS